VIEGEIGIGIGIGIEGEIEVEGEIGIGIEGEIEGEGGVGFVDKFRREIEVIPLFVCNLKHGNKAARRV
jgi:hypothetical protein